MYRNTIILFVFIILGIPTAVIAQEQSTEEIDELIQKLTLREKVRLVVGSGYGSLLSGFNIPFCKGIVPGAAGEVNGIKRLSVSPMVFSDGPAGLRLKGNCPTAYPIGSLLACTWDTALVRQVGQAMGREARDHGVNVILTPGMNLMRNPLCGRNFEYYSEDPLLTGRIASAMIRGIQEEGVGACAKHFAANNQETNRKHNDSQVDEQTLRRLYLKAFEIVVREAQPWTIMSSYNKLNGELTQESRRLLTDILREEWGYDGLVMTDWTGKRNTTDQLHAGNDLIMPGLKRQRWQLRRAVRKGKLTVEELDHAVRRVLELSQKTSVATAQRENPVANSSSSISLSRNLAAEGMVLLENKGHTLPIPLSGKHIALFGASSYEMIIGGTGSGHVSVPQDSITDLPKALCQEGAIVDQQLASQYLIYNKKKKSRYPSTFYLSRFLGKSGLKEMAVKKELIIESAQQNDLAIITLGRQAGEGKDRKLEDDFLLSKTEQALLRDVTESFHQQGKPVIVILNVGGVIETASWKHLPDAILLAWSPGQYGGQAITDILSGEVCPSGRLSMTWPVRYEDHPSSCHFPVGGKASGKDAQGLRPNYDYTVYAEGMKVGYRYFTDHPEQVSYPFGYGLSYTSFDVRKGEFQTDANGSRHCMVTVTNTGSCPGKTIVQLYEQSPSLVTELVSFAKTPLLQPGEYVTLDMQLFDDAD